MASETQAERDAFLQRNIRLLTDPDGFFEDQLRYPVMWKPGLLVLLAGITNMFQGIVTGVRMPPEISVELTAGIVLLSGIHLFGPITLWIFLALVWRVLTLITGGSARLYTLLRVAGYGFPPFIVTGALWSLGRWIGLSDVTYEFMSDQLWRIQDMQFELSAAAQYAERAVPDTTFQLLFVVGLLFTAFAVFLWIYGLSRAAGISKRRATPLVILPYLVYLYVTIEPVLISPPA